MFRVVFWCKGYHGRQLLCTVWESKSTHEMETYPVVGRLCPCTWSVIFLMGLNWLGLKLSSIFFLLFLFSRHIAVHSPIFSTLEYYTHARTCLTALCPGLPRVSQYQKGKTNLDFTEARDSEWQWHQLGHMQVYTSLQTDNHTSTPPLSFLQAGCPSCRPANSVKALKAHWNIKLVKFCLLSCCWYR